MAVKIYSTPTCPYCKMAKQFLEKNNIEFEEFNVMDDKEKLDEMVKLTGQTGVPVIDVGGHVMIGFDREALAEAVGLDI